MLEGVSDADFNLLESASRALAQGFDCSFDETQKRLWFYILKQMVIEHLREQRRNIADRNVFDDEREQGLA